MFIDTDTIRFLDEMALWAGFGREDYPHRSLSPTSAGDWKGQSIVACVFRYPDNAQAYLDATLPELYCLGGRLKGVIRVLRGTGTDMDGDLDMYIAVISGIDIELHPEDRTNEDKFGPEVTPTPADVLEKNANDSEPPSDKQVAYLRDLCNALGISEGCLIGLGIQTGRIGQHHTDRNTRALTDLTRSEIGGLFAFVPWLRER